MQSYFISIAKVFIGWPLSLVALFFVGKLIFNQTGSINLHAYTFQFSFLLYGLLCFTAYFLIRGYIWQKILDIRGYHLPLRQSMYSWAIAELRRYIPGNIFAFLSRTILFKQHEVPGAIIVSSLIFEAWYIMLSAIIISLLALPYLTSEFFPQLHVFSFFAFPMTLCVMIASALLILSKQLVVSKYTPQFLVHILPSFSASENIFLLFLHCIAFLIFGIGSYLTASAVVYLSPVYFISLSGFFTLALLVGYASILTPMGLGVREAIIVMGLTPMLPLQSAAFVALLVRLAMILGELIFLCIVSTWRHAKLSNISKIETWVNAHKHILLLSLFVGIFCLYFICITWLRHDNFYTGRFDLGNMDQTVWNTLHGRFFQMTDADGTAIISRLAVHADFILVLFAPVYLIWADPKMLLFLQVLIVAGGAYFVYLIVVTVLKDKNLGLLFGFLYLLNPAVQYTVIYDFHAVTLATTFLLGAYYFAFRKKYRYFLLFALLSAITKEQVWVIIAFFGIWIALRDHTKRLLGIGIAGISCFIFYYLVWHAIPDARGGAHFALSYYADYGDTPTKIVKNILLSPDKLLTTLFQSDRQNYLKQLFLPLGFLPVFAPIALLFAVPDLGLSLLSSNSQLHQIYYQYSATVTPFLFIAAILGAKKLKNAYPGFSVLLLSVFLLTTSFVASYQYGPLPGAENPNIDMFSNPQTNAGYIIDQLSRIPDYNSIAATNNLGAHLSHRKHIYIIPSGMEQARYIAILYSKDNPQSPLATQIQMVKTLQHDPDYEQLSGDDSFFLFQKITQ